MEKMTYDEFKEKFKENFVGFLPEELRGGEISIDVVKKVNSVKESVHFILPNVNVTPSIALEEVYENYLKNGTFSLAMEELAEAFVKSFENKPEIEMDKLKDNIVYQVINTERNEDLLKVIPHRNIGDLSVIYRGVVSSDESGISTYVVNNSFAKQFNLSEEQLYSIASKNMHNRYPATFEPLSNVISRIIGVKEMFNPEWDMNGDSKVPENELVLLRCGEQMWGASAILDNDVMDKVCNALDVDQVYVLPSSIYEVLICAANQYKDPEALAEMVQEINRNEVSEIDFLSDNVYLYDKNERRLTIANDVNKTMEIKRDNEIGITH